MGAVAHHRVRYVECDMQGVMHNSQYLAVIDDAIDVWVRPIGPAIEAAGWDFMVKRVEMTWHAPATVGDVLALDLAAVRFGTSSFDVGVEATTDGRAAFSAVVTYVGVDRTTRRPAAVPDLVRAHLA